MKERILTGAEELFMRYGIKSMTMDDVARHLSISKKTIYQHFTDKNELVYSVLKNHMDQEVCIIEEIKKESSDAIEEFYKMSKFMKQTFMDMNPSLIMDIQKYHPKSWQYFQEHKLDCFTQSMYDNLNWGIKEGYYRPEINVEILAVMRVETVEAGLKLQSFNGNKFSIVEVQLEMMNHFFHGIVTTKGLEKYNEYIQNNA
jgi:TetR/AcrR family transcriptional regulator, cholesterol catabolism regulator